MSFKDFISDEMNFTRMDESVTMAKAIAKHFAKDLKMDTKDEFTSKMLVQGQTGLRIDGMADKPAILIGSYHKGKSLVGDISYPRNAVVVDRQNKRLLLYKNGKMEKEINKKQFKAIMAYLVNGNHVYVSSSNFEEYTTGIIERF